jgi:hypothetical protein
MEKEMPEKINKPQTKSYNPVKVYLDDLIEIESLFTPLIEIFTEDYRYNTIQELVNHVGTSQKIKYLTIKPLTHPKVLIELRPDRVTLDVGSSDIASTGLFHKLDSILRGCQLPITQYYYLLLYISTTIASASLFQFASITLRDIISLDLALFFILICASLLRDHYKPRRALIILQRKSELRSFWQRNKDDLWKNVFSFILGVIAALIGKYLTGC